MSNNSTQDKKNGNGRLVQVLKQYWLAILLIAYFLASVTYQVALVTREPNLGVTPAKFLVDNRYWLALHYPSTIPLEPIGTKGRPLTVWMWAENEDEDIEAAKFDVLFFTKESPIVFTDADGLERDKRLEMQPAPLEPEAERVTVYVARRLNDLQNPKGELQIEVWQDRANLYLNESPAIIKLNLETNWNAITRKAGDLLLNTPALSWVSVISAAFAVWRSFREERRQREATLRTRIAQLEEAPAEKSWITYWELRTQAAELGIHELESLIKQIWERIKGQDSQNTWVPYFKAWLAEQVELHINKQIDIQETLSTLEEWGEISKENHETVTEFTTLEEITEKHLTIALKTFRILGLDGEKLILSKLPESLSYSYIAELKEYWYIKGGGSGRFLLRQKSKENDQLRSKLTEWIKEEDPTTAAKLLWPEHFPEISAAQIEGLKKILGNLDDLQTPFGPEKAEMDCRLPRPLTSLATAQECCQECYKGLFWDGHPLKESIWDKADGIFIAPPGSGRTTLIWMARYDYRFMGVMPGLSLYMPVEGNYDDKQFLLLTSSTLAVNLLDTLVEDPFWFLAAARVVQDEIAGFLLHYLGSQTALFRRLDRRVLLIHRSHPAHNQADADIELLKQRLQQSSKIIATSWDDLLQLIAMATSALAKARSKNPSEFPVFLWVDVHKNVHPQDAEAITTTLMGNSALHRLGYLKLFLPTAIPREGAKKLTWNAKDLGEMLKKRWESLNFDEGALCNKDISQINKQYGDLLNGSLLDHLVAEAQGTPQGIIRAGNRLLETLGRIPKDVGIC